MLLLLAGCMAFVLLGAWTAGLFGSPPKPGREWIGWLSIALFGLGGLAIGWRLFDRDDQIRIDAKGFYWKRWSGNLIPWSAIADVREARVSGQTLLCLLLEDPHRFASTTLMGRLSGTNKAMGFGDVTVTASGTDKSYAQLRNAFFAHWSAQREL
jgi:hypothetical protein